MCLEQGDQEVYSVCVNGRDEIRGERGRMGRRGQLFVHCFMDQDKDPKFDSE